MRAVTTILALLLSFWLGGCGSEAIGFSPPPSPPTQNPSPDEGGGESQIPSTMNITIGQSHFTATLADNAAARAFAAMLPLRLSMSDMNSNEKYASLSQSLPTLQSSSGMIYNGDIMLYGSTTLVLFYKTFSTSYSYTTIGRLDNPAALQRTLGLGGVTVLFEAQ